MLWIALHLPQLSLESWAATLALHAQNTPVALALMDAHRLCSVNPAAQQLGLHPGLKRATALALAPQVLLGRADEARDHQALMRVAHTALGFTPAVCLSPHPPHTVLLEVASSLRYFGGSTRLQQRLLASLMPSGPAAPHHQLHLASAPTAQGAACLVWLAAHAPPGSSENASWHCSDRTALLRVLDAAHWSILASTTEHEAALLSMGLRTWGALRRLPRAGLAQRFGPQLLDEIDRITGQQNDPREPLQPPDTFSARLELWTRADTTDQLLPAATVLLEQLVAWAQARQARVQRFTLTFHHEHSRRTRQAHAAQVAQLAQTPPADAAPTGSPSPPDLNADPTCSHLPVALSQPSADLAHLRALLREHLARWPLHAPTLEINLHCADWVHSAAPSLLLFPDPATQHEGLVQLIDRLQARLGTQGVRRLQAVADHRPECAQRSEPAPGLPRKTANAAMARRGSTAQLRVTAPPKRPMAALPQHASSANSSANPSSAPRPVWLLNPPQALQERQHRPWLDGHPLQLLSGPERIETGWWDEQLAERDYFIAQQASGAWVWVYRLRHPPVSDETRVMPRWFLQGRFG